MSDDQESQDEFNAECQALMDRLNSIVRGVNAGVAAYVLAYSANYIVHGLSTPKQREIARGYMAAGAMSGAQNAKPVGYTPPSGTVH